MIITEPDIQWWLSQRGYDLSYTNETDQTAMINELQKLGNSKAVLFATINKGYRKSGHNRHPHSWSIGARYGLSSLYHRGLFSKYMLV